MFRARPASSLVALHAAAAFVHALVWRDQNARPACGRTCGAIFRTAPAINRQCGSSPSSSLYLLDCKVVEQLVKVFEDHIKEDPRPHERALALVALCVGGMVLARNVCDP